jgi:polyisoprenoid-binding protein YceI
MPPSRSTTSGFSTQRGLFRNTSGQIRLDDEARSGDIEIRIDAASLDTGFKLRDDVLRGSDWFNVKSFPDIIFRSQRLEFNDERPVAVDGVLIMLGEIRPMRLEISRFKCGLNLALRKRGCGADAQGVLRRSDYGMLTTACPSSATRSGCAFRSRPICPEHAGFALKSCAGSLFLRK